MSSATLLEPAAAVPPEPADGKLYEVVNGQRVEKSAMSAYGTNIGFLLATRIQVFAETHHIGQATHEMLFPCPVPGDENRRRRPDAAFISNQRWPVDRPLPHTDPWPVVPDLAIEVVSPSNPAEEVMAKMEEYFQAGVQVVWIVYPRQRWVYVHTSPTQVRILTAADELDGGTVLPGFRLPLASLFGPAVQPA